MDLAKVDTPSRSIPQRTFREETTLPRADTRRDDLEVNAQILRPNKASNAEALAKLLGVAADVTGNIVGDIKAKKDTENADQAVFDFASGTQDAERFKNSRAYYNAWQLEGAKAKSLDIAQQATDAVQEVLNDPDSTVQDADAAIEKVFYTATHDEKGNLLDFGTPEAKLTLGHSLAEVKAKLMPAVHTEITDRQNEKLLNTTFDNMDVERVRGAPIGSPEAASAPLTVDPLAPLPDNPERAPTHILGTLSDPFEGFSKVHLTGVIGDARKGHTHNGEDYPVPAGTAIKAPMAGEVIASFSNKVGGNQVRVKMANGAIVGFAHLADRNVAVGDKVNAGELLGTSGQTGNATGPVIHMTVEVNGKKVSPRHYFASHSGDQVVVADGSEPELATAVDAPPPSNSPGFDIEGFMGRLPPSIPKGTAKSWLLKRLIAKAAQTGDASILNGLEDSKRPDGTPSLNPEEMLTVTETRDRIRDKARVEAERQKAKLQSDNMDKVLQAFNDGNPPSDSWIAQQSAQGLLDPQQAYTLISHNRALARQEATEARQEARADKAAQDAEINTAVSGLAVTLEAGDPEALGSTTEAGLTERWRNGEFGPLGSPSSLARYRTLRTALHQGQALVEKNPYYAKGMALLQNYKPNRRDGGNPLLITPQSNRLDAGTYTEMINRYRELVHSGKDPGEAYTMVVDKYVRGRSQTSQNPDSSALNRISYLKCKRAGLCK